MYILLLIFFHMLPDQVVTKDMRGALIRQADKVVAAEPASVMDKQACAPSGDKHDYYSMARYWWPNPATEDHLPYIRKDGQVNPETKNLDRENLSNFEKQIESLAIAYYYTKDEVYAEKLADCLNTWYVNPKTRMNPHMEYSQVVLGLDNNHGRKEGLLDTYGMIYITDILEIVSDSKAFCSKKGKKLQKGITDWFVQYVQWMTTSPQGVGKKGEDNSRNNHGTAYHVQLMTFAGIAGADSISQRYMHSFTQRRLIPQIKEDGSQPEELARTRGFGYSCFNLKHILDYLDYCYAHDYRVLEEDATAARLVKAAIDFLVPYAGKDVEDWPYQQINEWDKQQVEFKRILTRAHRYFPAQGYDAVAASMPALKRTDRRQFYEN